MENRKPPEANQPRSLNRLRECNIFSSVFVLVCHSVHKGIRGAPLRTCSNLFTWESCCLTFDWKTLLFGNCNGFLVLHSSDTHYRIVLPTEQSLFQYGAFTSFTFVSFPSYFIIFHWGWWRWGRDYDDTSAEEQNDERLHLVRIALRLNVITAERVGRYRCTPTGKRYVSKS